MSAKGEAAAALMAAGWNCAQATLCVFCEELALERGAALRLASGFGAGMGRRQEVCGAVTGGIMAIGLRHGPLAAGDKQAKEKSYRLTRELMDRFAAEFGSCHCHDLLRLDLTTEAGQRKYKEDELAERICRPCVRGAVRIVEEIL